MATLQLSTLRLAGLFIWSICFRRRRGVGGKENSQIAGNSGGQITYALKCLMNEQLHYLISRLIAKFIFKK